MEKILVVSKNPEACRAISKALGDRYKIYTEKRGSAWMDLVAGERHEIKVTAVSQTKTTVLFTGETGTGKGVMAKLLHSQSNRRDNLFVSRHCGATPENLVESELFGHEKGAFTGAVRRKLGKFEVAQSGTIFLDEVGTISPSVQIKLLNVLQEKLFQRVGGQETIERAYILENSSVLTPDSFPIEIFSSTLPVAAISMGAEEMSLSRARRKALADVERQYLQKTLSKNRGLINKSAGAAGISTRQLHKLMKKYAIDKKDFKFFFVGTRRPRPYFNK